MVERDIERTAALRDIQAVAKLTGVIKVCHAATYSQRGHS